MSEVQRLSLDMTYPFQYMENNEGNLCYYADYAALKAERDALAAENAAIKKQAVYIFNSGYIRGHESTVEGNYVHVYQSDMHSFHEDDVAEIINEHTIAAADLPSLSPVRNCLSFFASAIKSGESWSSTCQRDYDAALSILRNIEEAK